VAHDDDELRGDAGAAPARVATKRGVLDTDDARQRKVTLTLPAVPVGLPGEQPPPVPEEGGPTDAWGHEIASDVLDAWNRDRVQRSSFPPCADPAALPGLPSLTHVSPLPAAEAADDGACDALALVGRISSIPAPPPDPVSEVSERFALGDFSGCLRSAELLLGQDPEHELARHYADESRRKLEALYTSRLGREDGVIALAVPETEVPWLGLDSRLGLMLARVDGVSAWPRLVELSGLPRIEALRCLVELLDSRIVRFV
jgi:hypothetical protein